jgi:transcriptional regulator with XRE-family HTH domain
MKNKTKLKDIEVVNDVERLIILRSRLEMKVYEFADVIGVTPNYLTAVEKYRMPLSKQLVKKIDGFLETYSWEK